MLWEFSTGQVFRAKMLSLDVRMPQSEKDKESERFTNNRNIFQPPGKLLKKEKRNTEGFMEETFRDTTE